MGYRVDVLIFLCYAAARKSPCSVLTKGVDSLRVMELTYKPLILVVFQLYRRLRVVDSVSSG